MIWRYYDSATTLLHDTPVDFIFNNPPSTLAIRIVAHTENCQRKQRRGACFKNPEYDSWYNLLLFIIIIDFHIQAAPFIQILMVKAPKQPLKDKKDVS